MLILPKLNHNSAKEAILLSLICFSCLFTSSATAGMGMSSSHDDSIPMDRSSWDFLRDARFLDFKGRESIGLKGTFWEPGIATLKALDFSDGVIEFDMWIDFENPIFTGLQFRVNEENHRWEYVYFRPSANHQYNAFQYYPHYKKEMTWQLYGQHQRALDLPVGDWFHFRIEVEGRSITCTFNNQKHPFFFTDKLASGSDHGAIQFVSSSEVYVSNVKVIQKEQQQLKPFDATCTNLDPRYLAKWKVYPAIALEDDQDRVELQRFPKAMSTPIFIEAEEQGMISFTRSIDQPAANSAVLAEVEIESEMEQSKQLSFGYSDRMDLYLNGELIYRGDNSYRTASSTMRSRVHLGNAETELNFRKGNNLIQAVVYERSGGWGMITRLDNLKGISTAAAYE